jgi:hypothetical protein
MLAASSPRRTAAKALLARVLLADGRAFEALGLAGEAIAVLESLGGLDEGESLVRLVHAEALAAAGSPDADGAFVAARRSVAARAAAIADDHLRERFLALPENRRTLA